MDNLHQIMKEQMEYIYIYIYKKNLKWNGDDCGGSPSNTKRIREPI